MIAPRFFPISLKIQKKILQAKMIIGLSSQKEIDEIDKQIKDMEESLRKLPPGIF